MAETIAPGDVVRLRSGGPRMTVTYVRTLSTGERVADCMWFEGVRATSASFPFHALMRLPPGPE